MCAPPMREAHFGGWLGKPREQANEPERNTSHTWRGRRLLVAKWCETPVRIGYKMAGGEFRVAKEDTPPGALEGVGAD